MSLVDPAPKPPLLASEFRTLNKMYVYSWTSTLSPRSSAYYVGSYFIDASDANVHANVRATWGGNLEADFGYEVRCVR
jgi:hypothetical protein